MALWTSLTSVCALFSYLPPAATLFVSSWTLCYNYYMNLIRGRWPRAMLATCRACWLLRPATPVPTAIPPHDPAITAMLLLQEARIESFRQLLAAENAWVHERHDYTTLLRFLRASNYDATSARQQWVDSLHWRRVHHADSILTRFKFPERAAFLEAFPQGYHKTDRMGRPVFVQQIGRADFDKIFQITNDARLMQHHIAENERLLGVIFPAASAAVGADVHQTFVLLDLAGVRFANFMRLKKMMSMFLKMDQVRRRGCGFGVAPASVCKHCCCWI